MNAHNDGGPAFPKHAFHDQLGEDDSFIESKGGMTLRDYFAGQAAGECFAQALSKGFTAPQHIDEYTKRAAFWAYALADAMLSERAK
jgi:hypothetical protein